MSRVYRKNEHLKYALELFEEDNNLWFNNVQFIHQALLGISFNETSIATQIGDLQLESPIIINAMTGGSNETKEINEQLAIIAKESGLAIAVGSQMSALKNKDYVSTYEIVRKINKDGIIIANVGVEATVNQAKQAIEMVGADAIQIHINPIQELVMSEGDRNFNNSLDRIQSIGEEIKKPIIVKEVGFGISRECATALQKRGISIIDVGGKGGTSFVAIENKRRRNTVDIFNNYGIDTVASILEVNEVSNIDIVASGGINNSLQIAKALGLGASATGLAGIILKNLSEFNVEGTIAFIEQLHNELRLFMTSLGAKKISDLQHRPIIISGNLKDWCDLRKIPIEEIAQRKFNMN